VRRLIYLIIIISLLITGIDIIKAVEFTSSTGTESVSKPPRNKPGDPGTPAKSQIPAPSPTPSTTTEPGFSPAFEASPISPETPKKIKKPHFTSIEQFQEWAEWFYKHPDPDHFPDALFYIFRLHLHEVEDLGPTTAGFVAGIFHRYPGKIKDWAGSFDCLTTDEIIFVSFSLWLSGAPDSIAVSEDLIKKLPDGREKNELMGRFGVSPPSIDDMPFEGPDVIDILWGWFFATGDAGCIRRIISALLPDNMIPTDMIRSSLLTNAVDHERVLEILEEQLHYSSPDLVDELVDIIRQAKKIKKQKTRQKPLGPQ